MKVKLFAADVKTGLSVDYAEGGVRAGFPSPAQDYETESIDLNKELIRHPATTFLAFVDGEFTLKRIRIDKAGNCLWLVPANDDYPPLRVTSENHFVVWGVVTYNIKRQR